MDAHRADLAGVVEAHELPRRAGVGRLVDAATGGHVAAHAVRSGADVDHVRIAESATAIDPIDPTGILPSAIGVHVAPLSVVRNSPPLAAPM